MVEGPPLSTCPESSTQGTLSQNVDMLLDDATAKQDKLGAAKRKLMKDKTMDTFERKVRLVDGNTTKQVVEVVQQPPQAP